MFLILFFFFAISFPCGECVPGVLNAVTHKNESNNCDSDDCCSKHAECCGDESSVTVRWLCWDILLTYKPEAEVRK